MTSAKIYLAACGKFHAFHLASEFAALGRLGALYCADHHVAPPKNVEWKLYRNRLDIKMWRLASRKFNLKMGHTFTREAQIFDRWLKNDLEHGAAKGIFHGWNGHVGRTLKSLDPERWVRCVERSCPDNLYQHNLLLEESRRLEVPYNFDPGYIEKAYAELFDADVIVAPSSYSAASYTNPKLRDKVRVNPLGGNYLFREKARTTGKPIILTVGNSFLRKGIHYLLEGLRQLPALSVEVWIRGDVPQEYTKRITDSRVRIIPPVSGAALRDLFERASIFCLPSIDEGFGMVTMEALAYGLPLVVSKHVGAGDVLNRQVAEFVEIRDSDAIASAIQRILGWTSARYREFDEERRCILLNNSWRSCAQRMISSVYRR